MSKKVAKKIETEEERKNRELVESIANNISELAKSVRSLLNGPLKKKTLVVLLAHSSGRPQTQVEQVLKALEELESEWLK